jgi:hypothetical protein
LKIFDSSLQIHRVIAKSEIGEEQGKNGDAEDYRIPAQEHGQASEETSSLNLGYTPSSSSSQGINLSLFLNRCNLSIRIFV